MDSKQYYLNVIQPLINRKAYRPDEWEARGNVFDPECQIIIGSDKDSQEAARVTLERYGDLVMAAHVEIDRFVSLEVVFSPLAAEPVGFYDRLPDVMPSTRLPRCAAELIPPDFSGFIHIPASAKTWASVNVVACPSSKHLAQVWRGVNGERASSGVGF